MTITASGMTPAANIANTSLLARRSAGSAPPDPLRALSEPGRCAGNAGSCSSVCSTSVVRATLEDNPSCRTIFVAHTATPLSIPFVVKQSPLVAILPDLVTRLFQTHEDLRIEPLDLEDLKLPISMVIHRRDQSDPLVGFIMEELLATTMAVLPMEVGTL